MSSKFVMDHHIHSDNSVDGKDSVVKICEAAVEKKMLSITITDHCECNRYYTGGYYKAIYHSLVQAKKSRLIFEDRLNVLSGIELGQPTHDLKAAKEALSYGSYDFVLASIHRIKGKNDFDVMDYAQEDIHSIIDAYFEEIIQVIDWGEFDSLAHLTYPIRHINSKLGIKLDLDPFSEEINFLLKKLAKNSKAIEVNTLGLANNDWQADLYKGLLSKFFSFGGKYVTIGSDAHCCKNIGHGIKDGVKLIEKCGFENITVFKNRKPVLIKIN